MEIFKDLFPLEDRWGKDGVFTPTNIVKDMVDLLPDSIWNSESTFIDISCKTGAFLAEIYARLDTELSKLDEYKDPVKRRSHILNNQLFGLALHNDESLFFSRRNVFGDPFSDNIDVINAGNSSYIDLVKQKQYSIIETQLKGKFGRMKFDVVVGNPPYNNDIYLDFVTLGHHLSTQYTLMITPAKWQAKGGKKNEDFRANIVPCMSEIVYYKDCKELFDIAEPDGITYYLIDNERHINKTIKHVCSKNKVFDAGVEYSESNKYILIPSNIRTIIDKLNSNKMLQSTMKYITAMPISDYGQLIHMDGDISIVCGDKGVSGYSKCEKLSKAEIEKFKCYIHCMTQSGSGCIFNSSGTAIGGGKKRTFIAGPGEVPQGHYKILKIFDTLGEAESFVSFCDSKLISFAYFVGLSASMDVLENWRFIPDPGNFDHIFTDEELYNKYGLTDDEIKVIESVIKERKQ